MRQSRLGSLIESVANIFIGVAFQLTGQYLILPLVGINGLSFQSHLELTMFFTGIVLRRFFDGWTWFMSEGTPKIGRHIEPPKPWPRRR